MAGTEMRILHSRRRSITLQSRFGPASIGVIGHQTEKCAHMETQRLSPPQVSTGQNQADIRELGFGPVVARESRQRLLNRDGGFNVMHAGLGFLASLSLYHALLTTSWRKFFGLTALFYFGANLLFAAA